MHPKAVSTGRDKHSPSGRTTKFFPPTTISRSSSLTRTARLFGWATSRTLSTAWRTISWPRGWAPRNGEQPAVLLDIQRQPGANIIQTVESVKEIAAAADGRRYRPPFMLRSWPTARKRSGFSPRCAVHTASHDRARGDGDVPLSAKALGDGDHECGACRSRSSARSGSCIWPGSVWIIFR